MHGRTTQALRRAVFTARKEFSNTINVSTLSSLVSLPVHLYHALRIPLCLHIPAHKFIDTCDNLARILQHHGFSRTSV